MSECSIVVIGLPGSGKTTFLAALWHVIFNRELLTKLRFGSLARGTQQHLNIIAARWRKAQMQERTIVAGNQVVAINLVDAQGAPTVVTFPDIAGEAFGEMWELRECEAAVAETLSKGNILLFVHANKINQPHWVADIAAQAAALGPPEAEGEPVKWQPDLAPTQVKLVSLLTLLAESPLDAGPRRVALMLSAWDKASGEGLNPTEFLRDKLPLLHQYLSCNSQQWDWCAYGISAQGGDYDEVKDGAAKTAAAEALRALDVPSSRIKLVFENTESHDLTLPLAWLMT